MSNQKYDLVVIGGGPGGYVAAIRATQLGMKTVVVERERLGGICLNWGCIPSKALLESARLLDEMRRAAEFGLSCNDPKPDWSKVIQRSRKISDQMARGVEFLMRKNKIDIIKGQATLETPHRIRAVKDDDEKIFEAANIILATGARSRELPGLEYDGRRILGYREAMVLPEMPECVLVVGAGAIGCEFAYFYSVMGSAVVLVELLDQVLPLEDRETAAVVHRSFKKRGIDVHTSSKVINVKKTRGASKYTIEGQDGTAEVAADVCLVAVGVLANTENIGLDRVGVEVERGFIKVDDHMRTNVPGIWAIGDCAGPPLLAHVASHEGICAVETIAGLSVSPVDHNNIPAATYCHPQVASVGMTEQHAKEKGLDIKTGKYLFRANGRAVAGGETDGFVKFIIDANYGEVLGVHIVGPSASELIGEIVLGRALEATANEFSTTIHAHPTLSEVVMEAAGAALGTAIHA